MVFGEDPDQGVDRLLYGALTYTEDFVGSTHIPFAETLDAAWETQTDSPY
ncbi:MAG: hypothetical protein H0U02_13040 [Rubrobacter sp.]|nr:hypothetical protein [Rubrobacter sp.]